MNTLGLEEPCNILYDRRLVGNGFNAATDYVTTARLKKYKPDLQTDQDIRYEYCYFDYDAKNNNMDPIMVDKECNKTNPVFHAVPFISNVFENSDNESTRIAPHNKCVFKIEKDKLVLEEQQAFWNRISDMECDAQVQDINLQIIYLTKQTETCKDTLNAILKHFDQLVKTRLKNDQIIIQKQEELRACRHHLDVLIEEFQVLDVDYNRVDARYKQLGADCLKRTRELEMRLDSCTREFTILDNKSKDLHVQITGLINTQKTLENRLLVKSTALENLKKQLETAQAYLNELESKYFELQKSKKACETNLAECANSLSTCTQSLSKTKQSIAKAVADHITCMKDTSKCQASLKACEDERKVLEKIVADLTSIKNAKEAELARCRQINEALSKYNNELQVYLDSLRRRKTDCEKTHNEVGQQQDAVQVLEKEKTRHDTLNNMFMGWLYNVQHQLQKSADDNEGICLQNETAPPPPPPPREDPPANGAYLR